MIREEFYLEALRRGPRHLYYSEELKNFLGDRAPKKGITGRFTAEITDQDEEMVLDQDMKRCAQNWLLAASASGERDAERIRQIGRDTLRNEFRTQFIVLVCTNAKKFAKLRKEITTYRRHSQIALTSALSPGLGDSIGISAAVLVPLCAIAFLIILRLGKETFCSRAAEGLILKAGFQFTHLEDDDTPGLGFDSPRGPEAE